MKRLLVALTLCAACLCTERAAAQHEYDIWYFGQGFGLDFRGGAPVIATGSAIWTAEGSAGICDRLSGALLFYTDGASVYDRLHARMPNGFNLNGHISSTQSAVVVPMPGDTTRYYIFTTDQEGYAAPNRGTAYSIVDMTRNAGRGDVTVKNVAMRTPTAEKLIAVPHSNGTDTWVIVHGLGGNSFYAYLVDNVGVAAAPVISSVGASQTSPPGPTIWTVGYLKSSPSGRRLASACEGPGLVELFDFNPCSGVVSNAIQLDNTPLNAPYGITFSPDNARLYVAANRKLVQYDLSRYDSASIVASRVQLNDPANPAGAEIGGAMQIGPDGKIYTANSNWVGVINSPNALGQSCNYVSRSIRVSTIFGAFWLGLPNNIDAARTPGAPPAGVTLAPVGPIDLCAGDSVVVTAPSGFRSYRWSNGDTTRTTVVRASGTCTVEVADSNGCTDAGSILVRVHAPPQPTIEPDGPTSFCLGDSVRLQATPGMASYRWSTGALTASILARTAGRYSVDVVDSNGCAGTAALSITVHPNPQPTITGPATFCHGERATLDAGPGYAAYRWSSGETTQRITAVGTGTFTVEATDTNGCTGRSAPFTTTQLARIDPRIDPLRPATFCEGDSTVLSAAAGYRSYLWSTGATGRRITARASGRYALRVIDTNGCADSTWIDVVANPLPTPVIAHGGPLSFCAGEVVVLDAGPGYAIYQWSTGERTATVTVREGGSYVVTVTDSAGCTAAAAVEVVVNPLPRAAINGPVTVCPNAVCTYTVPDLPGALYRWDLTGMGTIIGGAGTNAATVRWGASGAGTIRLFLLTAAGCSDSSTIAVRIGTQLVPTITADRSTRLCDGDSVTLDAGAYATYRWSTGDTTRSIRTARPGAYTVTVSGADGCSGTSDPVTVVAAPTPTPIITAPRGTAVCAGDSVLLDAGPGFTEYRWSNGARSRTIVLHASDTVGVTVTDSGGCRGASAPVIVEVRPIPTPGIDGPRAACRDAVMHYTAFDSAGRPFAARFTAVGGVILSGADTPSIAVRWGAGPTGIIDLIIADAAGGCEARARLQVAIGDTMQPQITPSDSAALCGGGSVTLDAGTGYARYRWSTGDTVHAITVSDSGRYAVTVTTADGCSGSAVASVRLATPPAPIILPDGGVTVCAGESVVLEAPPGFAGYLWSTGERTRTITARASGAYVVTVTDGNGCSGTSAATRVEILAPPDPPIITRAGASLLSTPAVAYRWLRGDTVLAAETRQTLGAPTPGTYRVEILDSNGCPARSEPFEVRGGSIIRFDTVRAKVGEPVRLTLSISPPLGAGEMVRGFRVEVHIPPRSLFVLGIDTSSDAAQAGTTALHAGRDGNITLERNAGAPPIAGTVLARLVVEGLSTGEPLNPVAIAGVRMSGTVGITATDPGLVILEGCSIAGGSSFGRGVTILSVRPVPASDGAGVHYTAPRGSLPTLRLTDAAGREVLSTALPPGDGMEQRTDLDLRSVASGVYLLELRLDADRSARAIVISK